MVGITEDDFGVDVGFEFALVNGFYGPGRADGHKNGRLDGTVVGGERTRAGVGMRIAGGNCYGPAKRAMIEAWLADQGINRAAAYVRVYSDHVSDVPSFDWADEAIHLKYGYTWLQHMLGDERERLPEVVARAGEMWDTWLAERWERGEDGYRPYMERIDARIAAAEREAQTVPGSNQTA